MRKKVVVLGGGTGLSTLLRGLKNFPLDITAVVSVSDDGKSTGKLRQEFNQPAVGDIRRVIISLAETEPLIERMMDYRFNTYSDLNGHTVGNLLLTAMTSITGNMSEGIEALSKALNLKGRVIPLTEDNATLVAKMSDGKVIEGEHNITNYRGSIEKIYYKETPVVNPDVIEILKTADYIILSMGSVYTSIIPNLICSEVKKAIDSSEGKLVYVCNIMTQPGETDHLTASEHVKLINKYLGKRKVDAIVVNQETIPEKVRKQYETLEQKDEVLFDESVLNLMGIDVIKSNLVLIEDGYIRHNYKKLAAQIFIYTIEE